MGSQRCFCYQYSLKSCPISATSCWKTCVRTPDNCLIVGITYFFYTYQLLELGIPNFQQQHLPILAHCYQLQHDETISTLVLHIVQRCRGCNKIKDGLRPVVWNHASSLCASYAVTAPDIQKIQGSVRDAKRCPGGDHQSAQRAGRPLQSAYLLVDR